MLPISLIASAVGTGLSFIGGIRQARAARNEAKAQVAYNTEQRKLILANYLENISRTNEQQLQRQAAESEERQRILRDQLMARGLIENRVAVSNTTGKSVDVGRNQFIAEVDRQNRLLATNDANQRSEAEVQLGSLARQAQNSMQQFNQRIEVPTMGMSVFSAGLSAASQLGTAYGQYQQIKSNTQGLELLNKINPQQNPLPQPSGLQQGFNTVRTNFMNFYNRIGGR